MRLLVQPLGKSIEFQPGDNLLEVLRREAVPVSYSCSAGRCGTCRCKILRGSVEPMPKAFDARAQAVAVLACQTILVEDCVIEITEPDEIVVYPARILKATVAAIDAPTHDIRVLTLKTNRPLAHAPGQYATLQFSPEHARPYSMAGLSSDACMEFHIRLVPGGSVSEHVANHLRCGDSVRLSGPLGTAYLRRAHRGPMICVAGGTGLAPVLSIVRGALEAGHDAPIHMYFGVRSEDDLYGQQRLADLAARHANLRIHIVVVNGTTRAGHRCGLLTDAIACDWPAFDNWKAYICGSPAMVVATKEVLLARGLADVHIYADAFFPQTADTPQPA